VRIPEKQKYRCLHVAIQAGEALSGKETEKEDVLIEYRDIMEMPD
jgi:hypothetical protein